MNSWQIHDALQMRSLVIQFARRATQTSHVCFIPFPQLLVISYGYNEQGRYVRKFQDHFPYADYPELKHAHDGIGWNVPMLMSFLAECLAEEIKQDAIEIEKEGNHD